MERISRYLVAFSTGINTQANIEGALGGISIGGFLKRLVEDYSLIAKIRPYGASEGGKNIKYEISDNFLRFWFKYIHKNRSIVEMGNWKLLKKSSLMIILPIQVIFLKDTFAKR